MKSPNWTRDEAILALDLYYAVKENKEVSRTKQIEEVSRLLNRLPIHPVTTRTSTFRNPAGVELKLGNFSAIDPSYEGVGSTNWSKLDKQVFEEFYQRREVLRSIAARIRSVALDDKLGIQLGSVESSAEDEGAKEGAVVMRLHKYRERDRGIVKRKKEEAQKKKGRLVCEVCDFDFGATYGPLGEGFIECHHRVPLSELEPGRKTRLKDLALVCANCHRMLHREIDTLSVEGLKSILNAR